MCNSFQEGFKTWHYSWPNFKNLQKVWGLSCDSGTPWKTKWCAQLLPFQTQTLQHDREIAGNPIHGSNIMIINDLFKYTKMIILEVAFAMQIYHEKKYMFDFEINSSTRTPEPLRYFWRGLHFRFVLSRWGRILQYCNQRCERRCEGHWYQSCCKKQRAE